MNFIRVLKFMKVFEEVFTLVAFVKEIKIYS